MFRQETPRNYNHVTVSGNERFSEQTYFEPHHEHITNTSGWKLLAVAGIFFFIGSSILMYFSVRAYLYDLKTSYPSYLPGHGTIALYNSHSDKYWNHYTTCTFTNDTYIFSNPITNQGACPISDLVFDNFTFEVQMRIVKGDCGVIPGFGICQDGTYYANFYDAETSPQISTAIYQGHDQFNLIALVQKGNTFSIYINKQLISSATYTNFKQRIIYLGAFEPWKNSLHGYRQSDLVVEYKEVKVWTL